MSGEVKLWWWPLPKDGEIVPDHPPIELTEYIVGDVRLTHPSTTTVTYEIVADEKPETPVDVYRWFDHRGDIIEAPATEGRPTAYRWDDQCTHWMFGQPSSVAQFQAMTLCGKRALEVPGRGEVDCPECIEILSEAA